MSTAPAGYHFATRSANPLLQENWERIGKSLVINMLISIAVSLLIYVIASVFIDHQTAQNFAMKHPVISIALIVMAALTMNMLALSSYEEWRGCALKDE